VAGDVFLLLRSEIPGAKAVVATACLGFVGAGRAHQRFLLAVGFPSVLSKVLLYLLFSPQTNPALQRGRTSPILVRFDLWASNSKMKLELTTVRAPVKRHIVSLPAGLHGLSKKTVAA
jgi:hypothetical protein